MRFRVKDYVSLGVRQGLRLHEKGGNWLEVPVHHQLEEYLEAYLEAAGIRHDRDGVLFRAADPRRRLTGGRFGIRVKSSHVGKIRRCPKRNMPKQPGNVNSDSDLHSR